MDCTRCEELLFASLDGALAHGDRRSLRDHLGACPRCTALARLLREDAPVPEAIPPDDLLESVLRASSPIWARTFERMARELPEMATLPPDDAFVADVLAATTAATRRTQDAEATVPRQRQPLTSPRRALRGERPGVVFPTTLGGIPAPRFLTVRPVLAFLGRVGIDPERLRGAWQSLLQRPRLAFEGAYIGALAMVLVIGTPAWSLSVSPRELLSEIRTEQVAPVMQSVNRSVEPVVSTAGARAADLAARALSTVQTTATDLADSVSSAIDRSRTLWCAAVGCTNDQPVSSGSEEESDPSRRNP